MNTFTDTEVKLEMSRSDYNFMLIILGMGIGTLAYNNNLNTEAAMDLVNKINEGNPRWMPYAQKDIEELAQE